LWSERLVVGFWPHGVTIGDAAARRTESVNCGYWRNPLDQEENSWRATLDTLEGWITANAPKSVRVDIVISDHFVRHVVLPWSPELTEEQEWLALARARIDLTWGNAEAFELRIDRLRYKSSCLTCAMDRDLRTHLFALERHPGFKVNSIQPNFTATFNSLAIGIGNAATLVVVPERHSVTIGAVDGSAWRHVRTQPVVCNDASGIGKLVDRERLLLGLPSDVAVIYGPESDGPNLCSLAPN
jgi:hypothetical protein